MPELGTYGSVRGCLVTGIPTAITGVILLSAGRAAAKRDFNVAAEKAHPAGASLTAYARTGLLASSASHP
jgi:hypothetical protein